MHTMAVVHTYDSCCSCTWWLLFTHMMAVVHAHNSSRSHIWWLSFVHSTAVIHVMELGIWMNSYRLFVQGPGWYDMAYTCMNKRLFVHKPWCRSEWTMAVVHILYLQRPVKTSYWPVETATGWDQSLNHKKPTKTALNRLMSVQSSFSWSFNLWRLVPVPVLWNLDKRPDWTGLPSTTHNYQLQINRHLQCA